MQLDDLQKSAKALTDEELRDKILQIRADRRNYSRLEKKKAVTAKKADNIDDDEIRKLLAELGEGE